MKKEISEEVIKVLNFLLKNGHGGGNFRRLIIQLLAKYETDFSAQKDQTWEDQEKHQ